MPICFLHDFEAAPEEIVRHRFVKEIRHAIDEYLSWFTPLQGNLDRILVEREAKSVLVFPVAHPFEPRSKSFGVAVLASWGDLRAPG